jgi:hypothetical protein
MQVKVEREALPGRLHSQIDFVQIPDNAPRRKVGATKKVAAHLHLVDDAAGKRHDKPNFVSPDRPGQAWSGDIRRPAAAREMPICRWAEMAATNACR